ALDPGEALRAAKITYRLERTYAQSCSPSAFRCPGACSILYGNSNGDSELSSSTKGSVLHWRMARAHEPATSLERSSSGGDTASTGRKNRGMHAEPHGLVNPVEHNVTANTQLPLAA